ncbi:MAG: sulfur oxidation c-type cytochrome SoxX [Acidiferrobacterales bacterium]|nr:sulfur oxidation c-type cytochrome SoxX [Acidiferrobacterales bacterium]
MKKIINRCATRAQSPDGVRARDNPVLLMIGNPALSLLIGLFVILMLATKPALAQSASTVKPMKWPNQSECRSLPQSKDQAEADLVLAGWCIAIDDRRGNCIACHTFNVSPWPASLPVAGNLAPPMVAIRARFPDSALLRQIIEDPSSLNSHSSMPPYLKHEILTPQEIDQLIAFLGTL